MYPRFSSPRGFSPPFTNRGPSPGPQRFSGPPPQRGHLQRFHHPHPSPDYRGPRPNHPLSPTYDRGPPAFPPGEQHTPSPGFSPHGPPHRGHFRGHPGTGYSPRGPHGPPANHAVHTPPPGPGRGGFGPERGGRGGPRFGRGGPYHAHGGAGGGHHGGGRHQTGGQGFHPGQGQGGDGHGQGFKRNHNGPNNGPVPQKKQKIEKRDLPENNVHFCEICDRGFKTDEKFKEHTDQHTKCSVEGCNYTAAPKLVKLHYQWQHLTGFAKKIWNTTESPEDIKKWRQERRSHFPTAANKAKKAAIQEEKIQRGEVLETKFFGKTRGRGRGQGRGRGRGRGRRGRWDEPEEESGVTTADKEVKDKNEQAMITDKSKEDGSTMQTEQDRTSIPAGQDPLALLITNTKEDAELGDDAKDKTSETASALLGGLGSLLSCYADMSDSDKEEDKEPKEQSSKPASTEGKAEALLVTEMDTEMPPPAESVSDRGGRGGRRGRKRERGKNKNRNQNNKPVRKGPSLLEKLLAPEIRHERNVLLQCVRYIVRNNFFGVGPENETTGKGETKTATRDVDVQIMKPMDEATTL